VNEPLLLELTVFVLAAAHRRIESAHGKSSVRAAIAPLWMRSSLTMRRKV